jgi:hypothetical protein
VLNTICSRISIQQNILVRHSGIRIGRTPRLKGENSMFFVRGLSSRGKEIFVNPDQVLYVCPVGSLRNKAALVLTHRQRLIVDQDPETVRQKFEQYLKDVGGINDDDAPDANGGAKCGQGPYLN